MEVKGYSTLKTIIANVLNDLDGGNMAHYKKYMQWAIRGYKELKLFALPIATTVRLPVNSDIYSVTMPDDFVNFVAIGIPYNGKLWTFSEYKDLIPTTTEDCGQETQDTDFGENITQDTGEYIYNYGASGGINQYYYKKDFGNNRVLLNGSPTLTNVVLKYVSTGVNIGSQTFIPKVAEEALIAYIHWKRTQFDKSATAYDKASFKQDWITEFNKLKFVTGSDIEAMYDALYETMIPTIKR